MPQETPVDPLEYQNRIEEVKDLVSKGMLQREIVRYIREKKQDWNIEDRQARNYVYEAKKQLTEEANINRPQRFAIAMRRFDMLFYEAFKIRDFKTAGEMEWKAVKLGHLDDSTYILKWEQEGQKLGLSAEETSAIRERVIAEILTVENGQSVDTDE